MSQQDFHINRVIDSLSNQLTELDETGDITDETIATLPGEFYEDIVSQNPDGTWSRERVYIETNTLTATQKIEKDVEDTKNIVTSYVEIAKPYDEKIFDYNQSINQKKTQIVNLFNQAVLSGCTLKNFEQNSETLLINCVACGIGSTIFGDEVQVNRHINIENFNTEEVYNSYPYPLDNTQYGLGYENVARINSGSEIGNFISITDISPVCVGYANSIKALATEIENLRKERDSNIALVNTIKSDKDVQEFKLWNLTTFRTDLLASNLVKTQLSNITSVSEEIVLDKLFLYIDAAKGYSIKTKSNTLTGVNIITSIDNLGSDGSLISINSSNPSYDSLDGPSIWFNEYGITGKYFDFPKSYVLNINEAIDECGQTDLYGDASYSMESWIKITDTSYLTPNIITGGASIVGVASTAGIGLQVYEPETDKVSINFGSRGSGSLDTKTELSVDVWYHVVGVREKDKGSKIYLNGSLESSSNVIGIGTSSLYITSPLSGSVMRVGFCTSTYINQFFPGKISVIRLYSKALSDVEVLKNFNASKTRYGYSLGTGTSTP